ncbi:hypothetical protein BJY04DRAFT_233112 [Aspergillus karnatakaensis]|uniref:uncharacterized protein n=1 Tax=Aspergillus karnatakaensis TaxID=1810916 RepID=UPI003CCE4B18
MHLKNLFLSLGLLATPTLTSPTPEIPTDSATTVDLSTPSTNNTSSASILEKRGSGIWLDLYGSGSCSDSWRPEPQSGWVWEGQCKNFDGWTYGARPGAVGKSSDDWWNDRCKFKFWENADCHGHATVHWVLDSFELKGDPLSGLYANYKCFATANKGDGTFYLNNGARSVSMSC